MRAQGLKREKRGTLEVESCKTKMWWLFIFCIKTSLSFYYEKGSGEKLGFKNEKFKKLQIENFKIRWKFHQFWKLHTKISKDSEICSFSHDNASFFMKKVETTQLE